MVFEFAAQQIKLLFGLCVGGDDRHPAITEACRAFDHGVRRTAQPDGYRQLHRRRHDVDGLHVVKASLERHQFARPQAAQHFNLLCLPSAARVPLSAQCFVLDVVPADTDTQPQPPAAEQIHLGGLLGDQPGLALRCDENATRQANFGGNCREKTQHHEGFVEWIVFVVSRCPAVARGCAEHVIGHLDV